MKKSILVLSALAVPAIMIFSSCGGSTEQEAQTEESATEATTETVAMVDTVHAYICPMDCENSAGMEPGPCPVCGMDLVANSNYVGTTTQEPAMEEGTEMMDEGTMEEGHEDHDHS